jgi:hypothetical protein
MGKSRSAGNLVSENLIFTDISNDRVGIGSTLPSTKLDVNGDVRVVGILTVGSSSITLDGTENELKVGLGVTIHHTNGVQVGQNTLHSNGLDINSINVSGVVTATSFAGDGSNLSNVTSESLAIAYSIAL